MFAKKVLSILIAVICLFFSSCAVGSQTDSQQSNDSDKSEGATTIDYTKYGIYNAEYKSFLLRKRSIESFEFLENISSEALELTQIIIEDCTISDGTIIPYIESLTSLDIYDRNAYQIIQNNAHILDLTINTGESQNFDGLVQFEKLETLSSNDQINDLTALSSCKNLRILGIETTDEILSLEPLYNLPNLELVKLSEKTFAHLPDETHQHFSAQHFFAPRSTDKPNVVYY
jgi:hypothetical protein